MSDPASVVDAIAQVRRRIDDACAQAGRDPRAVTLVGVTKTHPPSVAQAAVEAGLVDLGENRIEELRDKAAWVRGARWHLVGRLQRRKAKDVVGRQVLVHSVDRRSLAESLSRRALDAEVVQRILVQVNVGDDPAKGGCSVDDALDLVAYARQLPHLTVEGLMTIPPLPGEDADADAVARGNYATLRALRDDARSRFPEVVHLSMGMSADLHVAVAEGATHVRVGTALFGTRGDGPWRGAPGGSEERT